MGGVGGVSGVGIRWDAGCRLIPGVGAPGEATVSHPSNATTVSLLETQSLSFSLSPPPSPLSLSLSLSHPVLYQSRWQSALRPWDAASHLGHMDSGAWSCRSAPRLH